MRHPHLLTPSLVAIAHGSRDPRAGATVAELLALARARASAHGLAGLEARAAFLGHAPPAPLQVLTALADGDGGDRDVVVLPLLLTAAYHSGTDIPELLAEATAGLPGLRIRYGQPLGPHPGLVRALERRLAEAGHDPGEDPARTAVVLASAGSSHPAANAAIARMASGWQAARGWHAVRPAYASAADPAPAAAVAGLLRDGAPRVAVATYLLAPGLFADRIRETSLAAGAVTVSAPLGASGEVAGVLLDRYQRAAAGGLADGGAIGQRDDARVSARLSARSRWVSAR
jgi:sirohydrochlorin ferrochelatase